MNPRALQPSAPTYQLLGFKDFMGWDELASLAHSLTHRPAAAAPKMPHGPEAHSPAADFNAAWNVTMPATLANLATVPEPPPFREAIEGLVIREMSEPEVFRHFFG